MRAFLGEDVLTEISLTGDQMLTVLETVAREGPINAADVARHCDMNRTVAHRLLATLAQRAYVRRSDEGYTVGPALLRLVQSVDLDLRAIAKPIMRRLAQETGETVVLHCIDNLEAVVIDQAVGQQHLVRVEHSPGSRHPLQIGASGLALLAFQSDKLIEKVLKKVTDPSGLKKRLDRTRADRYSISHDELQMGVHGLAAPVLEPGKGCQASLAILVPAARAKSLHAFTKALLTASQELSAKLG